LFVYDFRSSRGSVSCRVVYMVFMVALRLSMSITLRSAEVLPNNSNGCCIRNFSKRIVLEKFRAISYFFSLVCVFRPSNTCIHAYLLVCVCVYECGGGVCVSSTVSPHSNTHPKKKMHRILHVDGKTHVYNEKKEEGKGFFSFFFH